MEKKMEKKKKQINLDEKIKIWEWLLFFTVIALLIILTAWSYQDEVNTYHFQELSLIVLILILILPFTNFKSFGLILFLLLSFTLWFFFVLTCYSYFPAISGDLSAWGRNTKYLSQGLFEVEVIGRENYPGKVIYAPVQSHGTGITDFLSFGYLSDNFKLILKKLSENHPAYQITRKDCIYVPYKKNGAESGGNFEKVMSKGRQSLQDGYDLIIFPEGRYARKKFFNLSEWRYLEKLQSGCFYLSKKSGALIVPVIVEKYRCPNYVLTPGKFKIHLLKPINSEDKSISDMKQEYRQKVEKKLKAI